MKMFSMRSEFAQLSDLAIERGMKHSDLLAEVHQEVMGQYRLKYPKSPMGLAVFVDEVSGEVRIFKGDRDVTPPEFVAEAARIARGVVIGHLAKPHETVREITGEPTIFKKQSTKSGRRPILAALENLFFWGYNGYFVLFNFLMTVSLLTGGFGDKPWEVLKTVGLFRLFLAGVLLLTPAVTMWVAIRRRWWRNPGALLRAFFLFELPVVGICLLPLYALSATTPFLVVVICGALAIPGIFYVWETRAKIPEGWLKIALFIEQFVTMVTGYLALLYTFFVPVILGGVAKEFLGGLFYRSPIVRPMYYGTIYPPPSGPSLPELVWQLGWGVGVVLVVGAALLVPFLVVAVLWKALEKTRKELVEVATEERVLSFQAIIALVIFSIGAAVAYQPSNSKLLDRLKAVTSWETFAEREKAAEELAPAEKRIKQAILDSQNRSQRYFFDRDETTLGRAYEEIFNMDPAAASIIQKGFLTLAYPFVYQGERGDYEQLATNFHYVFGYPVYEAKAGPALEARNVLLAYRQVTVKPQLKGAAALVSIREEYDNQTFQQQEVVYEFTLPQGAVMTELRLGPNLEFPGVIAPKGAAQRTYEQQLQQRRDPALLEKTGPRQYRLRVFPIPSKNDLTTLQGRRQRVEYSYIVTADPAGYPLPQIQRKTNVFTNPGTEFVLQVGNSVDKLKEEAEFAPLAAGNKFDVCRDVLEGSTVGELGLETAFKSHSASTKLRNLACGSGGNLLEQVSGVKMAIFFDVSAANKKSGSWEAVEKTLKSNREFLSRNQVDLYKFNDRVSEKIALSGDALEDLGKMVYFGKSDIWKSLDRLEERYDVAVVVTSEKDPVTKTFAWPFSSDTQVYMVHSGKVPPYSVEVASKMTQSEGDVVASVEEAVRSYLLKKAAKEEYGPATQVVSSYFSATFSGRELTGQIPGGVKPEDKTLGAILNNALYQVVLAATLTDVTGDITWLDNLDKFAQEATIVTPYSSLISLVNEQQVELLEQLKQNYNRYQDQPVREQFVPQPLPVVGRFEDLRGIGPLGGLDKITNPAMEAPRGGGGRFGITTSGGGFAAGGVAAGPGLFVILNGLFLGGGLVVFLVRLLRKKE